MHYYTFNDDSVLTPATFPEVAGFGVQIPANGIELEEELTQKKGYAWMLQNNKPIQLKDNRGVYYSKETGTQIEFKKLGDIPSELTKKAPTSNYDKWDGKKWVKDTEAETEALKKQALEKRDKLLLETTEKIAPLQDAVDLEMATKEEIEQLKALKKYRVALNRIEQQEGFPESIYWGG